MKIKLDENIGRRGRDLLNSAGYDVMTVRDQQLEGSSDEKLFAVCAAEQRVLVTLDHDFGQVLRFPPSLAAGIVVLEPGTPVTSNSLLARMRELIAYASFNSPSGALWIIEPERIRVHLDS